MNIRRFGYLLFSIALVAFVTRAGVAADNLRIGTRVLPEEKGDPFVGLTLPWTLPLQAAFDTLTVIGPGGAAKHHVQPDPIALH
ncbi:MAG: hypothetical protein KDE14_04435 [Rhodobacteraceae bacterium]|nr:hypothetical protein [Paracoccaceae bacterium]